MFRGHEFRGVLVFFASFFFLGTCLVSDFSKDKFELLLEELKHAEKVICDNESKSFLISVLKNPDLLKKNCFKKRAMLLYKRALLIMKLESMLFSGGIKDKETKDKVEHWLDHQVLLNDSKVLQEVELLIKNIEEEKGRRIELVILWLQNIKDFIEDEQTKEKVQEWLSNPELLHKENVLKEAEAIILEIRKELSASDKKVEKVIKNVGLPLYTIYRKFRFLKNLDNGTFASDRAWYFDFFVSMILESMNDLNQEGVHIRSGIDVVMDDISEFIKIRGEENINQNQGDKNIQLHGCQQTSLSFYYIFDSYIDNLVEKLLVNVGDEGEYSFHKNEAVRFLRKILLCKFFPTYLYWLARGRFEKAPANATPEESQQIDEQRLRFSSYVPFKEAVKSSEKLLEYKLSDFLVKQLNGKTGQDGKSDFDRTRDYTLGLVGQNLVSLGFKLAMPRAMIATTNKIKSKLGGQGAFLGEDDYFRPGDRDLVQHVRRESISYAIRNVVFYCLPKLFKKYRPKLFNWTWAKTKKFLGFLERRGWVFTLLSELRPEMDENVGFGLLQLCLELINCRLGMRMTAFDHKETWKEVMKTSDIWRALDYHVAFWIGSWLGRKAVS